MRSDMINEKGMTLVEILAALVILGIVFVGFMTVFPQMTNFNEKTETKLESMNLARMKLNSLKHAAIPDDCIVTINACTNIDKDSEDGYIIEITYKQSPDLIPVNSKSGDQQVSLYQIHIKYFRANQDPLTRRPISETFGYVFRR